MIKVAYFLLLCLGDYTGSKSDITPFCLKDIAFSCGRSVFSETATKSDLQDTVFVKLAFMAHNNGLRVKKIGHKASMEPLMCPKSALLQHTLHLKANNVPPYTSLSCAMTTMGR